MKTGTWRPRYIGAIVLLSASGAACGKVTLDNPGDPVDALVPVEDARPVPADARAPAPDARNTPDARVAPDAATPPDAGTPCDDGEIQRRDPVTGRCYMLFQTARVSWFNAREACEDLVPPAHLVTVTSAEEHALAIELSGMTNVWMGAHDRVDQGAEEGVFAWITGEPMDYQAWADGEPNNGAPDGPDEDCAILLNNDQTRPDSWDDRVCGSTRAFLCERD